MERSLTDDTAPLIGGTAGAPSTAGLFAVQDGYRGGNCRTPGFSSRSMKTAPGGRSRASQFGTPRAQGQVGPRNSSTASPLDGACTSMTSPRPLALWCFITFMTFPSWPLHADASGEITRTMRLEQHAWRLVRLCEEGAAAGRTVPLAGPDLEEFRGVLGQLAATNPTDATGMRQTFGRLCLLCDHIVAKTVTDPAPASAGIWAVSLGSKSVRTPAIPRAATNLPLTLTPAEQAWRDVRHETRALELRWRRIEASIASLDGQLARHESCAP